MIAVPTINKNILRTGLLFLTVVAGGHFIAYKIVHIPTQLELVVLLTAAFFYPVLRKPAIGVYLLFIIMPFIPFLRRSYYLLDQRPSIDPLIAVGDVIIALTLIGLFFVFREQREREDRNRFINGAVLGYFLYCLFRTFFFNILPPREAIMQFHFYGPAVIFYFIGTLYADNMAMLKKIWYLTIGIGVVVTLYGMKQLFLGYSEAEQIWFSSISFTTLFIKGIARPFSVFQSPACFADYMLISIIGVLIIASDKKMKWSFAVLLLVPFFFYGALITSVRSNWIGIMLALMLWLILLQIRGARYRAVMILLLGVFFFISQLLDFSAHYNVGINALFSTLGRGLKQEHLHLLVTERTGAISNPFEEHSFLSRIAFWKYLLALSAEPVNALLGRGIGTINADSLYITFLAQFGYPGVIFIVWFIVVTINKGFTLLDSAPSPEIISLAKGITLMNIVFAVINLTGTHIHSFPGDVFFWFWNGALVKLTAVRPQNR
ncbi:MAG: hypothetical protein JXA18_03245 [Chitinispirillaceae bacterium]|nr:hypothetical protein [Chitinispirillaceae bacterium]